MDQIKTGESIRSEENASKDCSSAGTDGTTHLKYEAQTPIGSETLQTVLEIEDDAELILKLSSEMNGFLLLLDQQNIPCELLCQILAALARASECSSEADVVQILVHFYIKIIPKLKGNANFRCELIMYSANLWNFLEHQPSERQMHIDAVQNLLIFLRRLQSILYQKSYDIVQDIVNQFSIQIEYISRKGHSLNDRINELIKELHSSMERFDEMKAETEQREVLLEPPNNFREIPIYPTMEDILYDHEPFIRQNVIKGRYVGGIEHYLDTQFRLLREDFVRPLRSGISEYVRLSDKTDAMKVSNHRISDLNVYRNVNIVGSEMIHNEQMYLCRFDCKPFRNLRWQYTKRMMNGSLVCFSPDEFKTFFFATVTGLRDPVKLAQGHFKIKLEMEDKSVPEITPLITYVMVESQVFFEAYRYNLKVLQDLNKENFPLERYIVDVNKEILPPTYLNEHTVYSIANGFDEHASHLPVEILQTDKWPPHTDFNLDETQYEAFRAALTKQIAVIQGPPGTGKTYVGLRIVQTLLTNTTKFPILVVCYTNHALDQFLEGILKFCDPDELIRIGGNSESETLQKLNLANIKKSMKENHEVSDYICKARSKTISSMKEWQTKISTLELELDALKKRFFGEELENVIKRCNYMHFSQLKQLNSKEESLNISILHWLGYGVNFNDDKNFDRYGNHDTYTNNGECTGDAVVQDIFDEEEMIEIEQKRIIDYYSDDEEQKPRVQYPKQNQGMNLSIFLHDIDDINSIELKYKNLRSNDNDWRSKDNDWRSKDNDWRSKDNEWRTQDKNWRSKKNKAILKNEFQNEMDKSETMTIGEAKDVDDINSLTKNQRWNLYRLWFKLYVKKMVDGINTCREAYRNQYRQYISIRNQEDVGISCRAKIIGMTTTGAAKYSHIITDVEPTITIVEEAAEVLEAHIVTALCKKTDHLILIGDHMQLRPNPAVYELSKKFNLEISLFERLIKNQMEFFQLKQQHRMRPCISSLLVPYIYKELLDHPSVGKYDDVRGMGKNMFFINHQQNEMSQLDTRSHINSFEAKFIVGLCRYIILQGYDKSQVTILTTYSGQLHQIRGLMREHQLLSGVRATVVDNYQGEENDIILLSFVRSNDEANIGFLKISNRINVALSRARKGLYCIGNFNCMAEKSQLWKDLIQHLTNQEAIGDSLMIYCQNHTDYKICVKTENDFSRAPNGGCMRPCEFRLPCGHSCPTVCHYIDKEHEGIYKTCPKKCDKFVCDNKHQCSKQCHFNEECEKCTVPVEKVHPECGHSITVPCSSNPLDASCPHPCERERGCGHKCKGSCGETCNDTKCIVRVRKQAECGHTVTIECSNSNDSLKLSEVCTRPCNIELKCGHSCKGTCTACKYGRLHISCREKCTRILICGHPCTDLCSVDCSPCKERCNMRCIHNKCQLSCGEPCRPCLEKCEWGCEHSKCTKLCSEPCDRELCEHPPERIIQKCGHASIGVCGENEPSLCRICDKDAVEDVCLFFGKENNENARLLELDDCKHVFELEGLKQWMGSEPVSTESNTDDDKRNNIQLKKCPKCGIIIRNTKALNTFVHANSKDIQHIKLQMFGNRRNNQYMQRELNERCQTMLKKTLYKDLRPIVEDIGRETQLSQENRLPKLKLVESYNKFRLAKRLLKIFECFNERDLEKSEILYDKVIEQFINRMQFATDFIKTYRNCDQTRYDIETEIEFLYVMAEVIAKAGEKEFRETSNALLDDAFKLANQYGYATESVQSKFKMIVIEALDYEISIKKKKIILKAMGFQKGHWYKCSEGHIYCIDDCGGAKEKSTCPECKLKPRSRLLLSI